MRRNILGITQNLTISRIEVLRTARHPGWSGTCPTCGHNETGSNRYQVVAKMLSHYTWNHKWDGTTNATAELERRALLVPRRLGTV